MNALFAEGEEVICGDTWDIEENIQKKKSKRFTIKKKLFLI